MSHQQPPVVKENIRDGYYFTYREESNWSGGYHPVELTLHNDEENLHVAITDKFGAFCHFPGVREGAWQKDLVGPFRKEIGFVFRRSLPENENDLLTFRWMVQPDGRYYADDDGFGMEDDREIWLIAGMDRKGRFTTPFHEE